MRRTLSICIALLLALTTACSAPGAASTSQASVSSAPAQPTQTTDLIPDKAAQAPEPVRPGRDPWTPRRIS